MYLVSAEVILRVYASQSFTVHIQQRHAIYANILESFVVHKPPSNTTKTIKKRSSQSNREKKKKTMKNTTNKFGRQSHWRNIL